MARRNHLTARQDEELTLASDSSTDALAAVPLVYDYDQIATEHRAQVREDAAYIKAGMHRTSKEMLEWGARLIRIKERTEHGQFGDILTTEFGFSEPRLPQMWMAAAERLNDKSEKFSHLPASALYLLGAKSTPDEAIAQIEERIDAGEQMGLNDVKETVNELKRPAAHVLTLDETIAVIGAALKGHQTVQDRLAMLKLRRGSADYSHLLRDGQVFAPSTFNDAWYTAMRGLESQIEYARKHHVQAPHLQQRTLDDTATEEQPKPVRQADAHVEAEEPTHQVTTETDPRLDRIAAVSAAFNQCLDAFKAYSELTGDFAGPTVPKLGIRSMQKKLADLASILEDS